jgi:uncharacterized phage protein (predicted DNA packaging)
MITLADAKTHCRVDHDDDDAAIEGMIAAASDHPQSTGVDVAADPPHPAVRHAALMLVAHWYENREAVRDVRTAAVEIGVDRLTAPYREVCLP